MLLSTYPGSLMGHFKKLLETRLLEVFHFRRSEIKANRKAWMETNRDAYHMFFPVVLRRTQVEAAR